MNTRVEESLGGFHHPLAIILLVVTLQWGLYLMVGYDHQTGAWTTVHTDTMHTLMIARTWAHGHPLQLLPGDPPSTMLSDLLSPLLFSTGYWLGFRSPSSFVFWSYIMGLIVALVSSYYVWRFCRRFVPDVAFPATLLSMTFTGVFSNIFHTNFGFFFMFFWGALAYMHSFPRFLLFSILAALTRPEGLLVYLFLVLLYVTVEGKATLPRFLLGIPAILIPSFAYKLLTGSFMPQGVAPQNIIQYQGLLESIRFACIGTIDQIKGALMGLYSTGTRIGNEGSGWLGTFPPLLFVLAILGLGKYKKVWLALVSGYLLVLIVGDSFTIFSAAHQNRHITVLTPFLFGFAFWFVRGTKIREGSLYVPAAAFFLLVVALQFFGALTSQETVKNNMSCDKQLADHMSDTFPGTSVLNATNSIPYWVDGRLRCHTLSPASDPYLAAYIPRYFRPLETSELIQTLCPGRVIFIFRHDNSLTEQWFSQFSIRQVSSCMREYRQIAAAHLLDLSRIRDRAPYGEPYSELDVGDPSSELTANYRFDDSLERKLGSFLVEGEGFWDGGRPGVITEEFDLPVPEGGGTLVCRYSGSFQGNILEEFDKSPVTLAVNRPRLLITANGYSVFDEEIRLGEEFTHLSIPLHVEGTIHFSMKGAVHSFHYWVYEGDVAD